MRLEIVTHCWDYPRLLCWHLSGLILHPIQGLTLTLIYPDDDEKTRDVIDYYRPYIEPPLMRPAFRLHALCLPREQVCRRAIGRNRAARTTKADWVWFCDVDHITGPGCLQSMAEALARVPACEALAYPRQIMSSTTQADGDRYVEMMGRPTVAEVGAGFSPQGYSRAIGGVQLARGDYLRRHGYCPDTRYQHPGLHPGRFSEDKAFRFQVGTRGYPIDVANLYRIRHSVRGWLDSGVSL